jgi:hypothetical protein
MPKPPPAAHLKKLAMSTFFAGHRGLGRRTRPLPTLEGQGSLLKAVSMPKEGGGQIFGVWPYAGGTPIGFREETPDIWLLHREVVFFLKYRSEGRTPPPLRCPAH